MGKPGSLSSAIMEQRDELRAHELRPGAACLPRHVAIVMDGNGRWAKKRGFARFAGHRKGVDAVKDAVKCCARYRISCLTLFAFSSENWKRPATEVSLLMELLTATLENEVQRLNDNGVRLRVIGDTSRFSAKLRRLIANAEQLTQRNTVMNLTIAANYGGRWDIAMAARRIAEQVAAGELDPGQVSESTIERHMSTFGLPEPDLFIRTGGEARISNFLLWQLAYTELYFTDVFWPEFGVQEFEDALADFSCRRRRFGRIDEQLDCADTTKNA